MAKVIKLRAHHIVNLLRDDVHDSDERLKNQILAVKFSNNNPKYSERMADKIVEVKNAVINGTPILVVPSIDDICECCNIWREDEEHAESCPESDDDFSQYTLVKTFGPGNGGIYLPVDLFFVLKREYEKLVADYRRDETDYVLAGARDYCQRRLDNYARFYEQLKNNGGKLQ